MTFTTKLLAVIALSAGEWVSAVIDKELYDVLGVLPSASASEIKKAFRKLSVSKHPDRNKAKNAQDEFTEIQEAHDILSDPDLRHMYDLYGKEGVMDVGDTPTHNQGDGGGMFGNMFGGLFGGGGGGGRRGPRRGNVGRGGNSQAIKRNMPRTQDLMVQMSVTLEELYNGAQKKFSFQRNVLCSHCRGTGAQGGETTKCKKCKGSGRIVVTQEVMPGFRMQSEQTCPKCRGRGQMFKHECHVCKGSGVHPQMTRLELDIERGMKDGAVVKFERKSEERPGHIPGDVHVKLKMEGESPFKRDGNDLMVTTEITLEQALLGFDLNLQHMDKHLVSLKHYDVTPHKRRRKYKGEGMPKHGDYILKNGNLFVDFKVVFPTEVSQSDKDALHKVFPDLALDTYTPVRG